MMTGAFKSMRHEHYFEFIDGKTHMRDVFNYEVPYGITGKIFDRLVLKSYMRKLLISRNNFIKKTAEQDES